MVLIKSPTSLLEHLLVSRFQPLDRSNNLLHSSIINQIRPKNPPKQTKNNGQIGKIGTQNSLRISIQQSTQSGVGHPALFLVLADRQKGHKSLHKLGKVDALSLVETDLTQRRNSVLSGMNILNSPSIFSRRDLAQSVSSSVGQRSESLSTILGKQTETIHSSLTDIGDLVSAESTVGLEEVLNMGSDGLSEVLGHIVEDAETHLDVTRATVGSDELLPDLTITLKEDGEVVGLVNLEKLASQLSNEANHIVISLGHVLKLLSLELIEIFLSLSPGLAAVGTGLEVLSENLVQNFVGALEGLGVVRVLTDQINTLGVSLQHGNVSLNVNLLLDSLQQRSLEEVPQLNSRAHVLASGSQVSNGAGNEARAARGSGVTDSIVVGESEGVGHQLSDGLDVREEVTFHLVGEAEDNVDSSRFVLSLRGLDANNGIFSEREDFPAFSVIINLFTIDNLDLRLNLGKFKELGHAHIQIRLEVSSEALAQTGPGHVHRRHLGVRSDFEVVQKVNDFVSILAEDFLSDGNTNDASALHSLATEEKVLLGDSSLQDILQERHEVTIEGTELLLGSVSKGSNSSDNLLLDDLGGLQETVELLEDGLEERSNELLRALFAEVDDGRGSVGLNTGVGAIVEDGDEGAQDVVGVGNLDVRLEIGTHLTNGVAGGPTDTRVGVLAEGENHTDNLVQMLEQVVGSSLTAHRDGEQTGVTPVPVLRAQKDRDGREQNGDESGTSHGNGKTIKRLLSDSGVNIIKIFLLTLVPILVVLNASSPLQQQSNDTLHKVGDLTDHTGLGLSQSHHGFNTQLTDGILKLVRLGNLEHQLDQFHHVGAEELGGKLDHFNQIFHSKRTGFEVAALQTGSDSIENSRAEVLQSGHFLRLFFNHGKETIDQQEGGDTDLGGGVGEDFGQEGEEVVEVTFQILGNTVGQGTVVGKRKERRRELKIEN